jgi:hypothetical protein
MEGRIRAEILCVIGPSKHREGKETRGEPRVEHIRIAGDAHRPAGILGLGARQGLRICNHTCTNIHQHTCDTYKYTFASIQTYIHTHQSLTHTHTHTHAHAHKYVCQCVCIYLCVSVCECVGVYNYVSGVVYLCFIASHHPLISGVTIRHGTIDGNEIGRDLMAPP